MANTNKRPRLSSTGAISWDHALVDLQSFVAQLDSFEMILRLPHTHKLCQWDKTELERGMQWALYLEQVVGQIEHAGDRRVLDRVLCETNSNKCGAQARALRSTTLVGCARRIFLQTLLHSSFLCRHKSLLLWVTHHYLSGPAVADACSHLVTPNVALHPQFISDLRDRARGQARNAAMIEMCLALRPLCRRLLNLSCSSCSLPAADVGSNTIAAGHRSLAARRATAVTFAQHCLLPSTLRKRAQAMLLRHDLLHLVSTKSSLPQHKHQHEQLQRVLQSLRTYSTLDLQSMEVVCHAMLPVEPISGVSRGIAGQQASHSSDGAVDVAHHLRHVLLYAGSTGRLLLLHPALLLEMARRDTEIAQELVLQVTAACASHNTVQAKHMQHSDAYTARRLLEKLSMLNPSLFAK